MRNKYARQAQFRRYVERKRIACLEKIGYCCIFCNRLVDIEFAHVIPTGICGESRGQYRRYRDVLQNPECYRPMCSEHHKQFDRGNIRLADARYVKASYQNNINPST